MLQLLIGTNIGFMRQRRIGYMVSGALALATAVWLVVHGGPRYGVDFTGGTLIQIRTSRVLPADQVRSALDVGGLHGFELQQLAGENRNEFMIRLRSAEEKDPFQAVQRAIQSRFAGEAVELRRSEAVGPKVGGELRAKAIWAVLGSLAGILLYVGFRYEFKFALGAVVALFHDVFVTLGVLCLLNREVTLTVVAALLTIAGYSINDTIVVFDRIRERSKALRKEKHSRAMDVAVNETLSRTVITSLTVFLTALSLLIWGGEVLRDFSLAMVVGVGFGTYSSVYVASALALDIWIGLDRRRGIQAE
ncbi:MAG: protein translocase subunit SecF [Candidatus Eisenbacteria bacterium]|uniref:Protein-export membrane protein SecF n=1 Tax=Eiseniibacteriota bacterium TaxID=2212470 RepID=A0A538TTX4_UNCEI|nr:MAG: protein translocase subunit SecF [Candidatus Eisenbacteria bacterium]